MIKKQVFLSTKEVKEDTKKVSNTKQIRIQRETANKQDKNHVIVTGKGTKVAKTFAEEGSTIIRRTDLGPQSGLLSKFVNFAKSIGSNILNIFKKFEANK